MANYNTDRGRRFKHPESPSKPKKLKENSFWNKKKRAQSTHAGRRLKSRFGLEYTPELRRRLHKKIKHRNAQVIRKVSDAIFIYRLEVKASYELGIPKDMTLIAVYDRPRREIVTFLTTNQVNWWQESDAK